jgi:hypothetical protein
MRDTIDMAREAGFELDCTSLDWHKRIKAFEALVRADAIADEREMCAKAAEDFLTSGRLPWVAAAAIRERSLNAGARGEA